MVIPKSQNVITKPYNVIAKRAKILKRHNVLFT